MSLEVGLVDGTQGLRELVDKPESIRGLIFIPLNQS
jgi:hypothetical protein